MLVGRSGTLYNVVRADVGVEYAPCCDDGPRSEFSSSSSFFSRVMLLFSEGTVSTCARPAFVRKRHRNTPLDGARAAITLKGRIARPA